MEAQGYIANANCGVPSQTSKGQAGTITLGKRFENRVLRAHSSATVKGKD